METIFENAVNQVSNGARFNIDFYKKTFRINGKTIINNGKYDESVTLISSSPESTEELVKQLEFLYMQYKYSRPTEYSESCRHYFKCLAEEELDDEDIMYAPIRNVAQLKLELSILIYSINGTIKWDELADNPEHYFWQSKTDSDFVILKSWII